MPCDFCLHVTVFHLSLFTSQYFRVFFVLGILEFQNPCVMFVTFVIHCVGTQRNLFILKICVFQCHAIKKKKIL